MDGRNEVDHRLSPLQRLQLKQTESKAGRALLCKVSVGSRGLAPGEGCKGKGVLLPWLNICIFHPPF